MTRIYGPRRRLRNAPVSSSTSPQSISAVSGWLRLADRTDTGTLTVPDLFGGPSAVQAVAGQKPAFSTSNGLPIAVWDGSNDALTQDDDDDSNDRTTPWGLAGWVRPTSVSGRGTILTGHLTTTETAAIRKVWIYRSGSSLVIDIYSNIAVLTRRCTVTSAFTLNAWSFITVEYDGSGATEADQVIVSIDGVADTVAFSAGTAVPAALTNISTVFCLFTRRTDASNETWVGESGPNFYWLNRQLTAPERLNLMGFEDPS